MRTSIRVETARNAGGLSSGETVGNIVTVGRAVVPHAHGIAVVQLGDRVRFQLMAD